MLQNERQTQIYTIIQKKKFVSIRELTKECYSSVSTVRRDLCALEQLGLIKRIRGGAVLPNKMETAVARTFREHENLEAKKSIAELAVDYLKDNMVVFFDCSTTVEAMFPYLKRFSNMVYITDGLSIAKLLIQLPDCKVYLAGGQLTGQRMSIADAMSIEFISKWHADVAMLSCSGISAACGATGSEIDMIYVKKAMIRNSTTSVLLIDSSKFDRVYMYMLSDYTDLTAVVCDQCPSDELRDAILKAGCDLVYPND